MIQEQDIVVFQGRGDERLALGQSTSHPDKKMAICGNILYRRKFSLAKEIMLLIKPVYTRGDWGFSLEMVSASRFRLLPGVFVGSYSKSLSQARTLGKEIQKLVMQLTQPDTRCRICLHERQGVSRYVR